MQGKSPTHYTTPSSVLDFKRFVAKLDVPALLPDALGKGGRLVPGRHLVALWRLVSSGLRAETRTCPVSERPWRVSGRRCWDLAALSPTGVRILGAQSCSHPLPSTHSNFFCRLVVWSSKEGAGRPVWPGGLGQGRRTSWLMRAGR